MDLQKALLVECFDLDYPAHQPAGDRRHLGVDVFILLEAEQFRQRPHRDAIAVEVGITGADRRDQP